MLVVVTDTLVNIFVCVCLSLPGCSHTCTVHYTGVLELHSMLTQDQYWESFKNVLAQEKDATFAGKKKIFGKHFLFCCLSLSTIHVYTSGFKVVYP